MAPSGLLPSDESNRFRGRIWSRVDNNVQGGVQGRHVDDAFALAERKEILKMNFKDKNQENSYFRSGGGKKLRF